ncbi:SRPBCC family protein [Piscinibacter sp.]|jgi:hypothetical protein|uniref:SRPBCC family protein n=1 Tax=Piscinibacter sp. TaxID=1903157 RepID=UPI003559C953
MKLVNQHHSIGQAGDGKRVVQAVGLGLLMASTVAASATERAVSVVETVQLAAAPTKTWAAIKDFTTWQAWHPAFATTDLVRGDGHTQGSVRVLITKDGGKFTEELVSYNAASRSYQYRIIDSPAPVADYVSTIEVKETQAGSTVVWSSSFNVKAGTSEADAKKLISGVYRAGLDNLASVVK